MDSERDAIEDATAAKGMTAAGSAAGSGEAVARAAWPPEGWVRREDVARMFGIAPGTLKGWYRSGRIRFGKDVAKPGGGRCKIYPVADLERLRAEMDAERGRLPAGYVGRDEAARMFNLTVSGWKKWRHLPRVPQGQWTKVPGLRPLVKLYPLDGLKRLREALEAEGEPYPDPDRPRCYRVPVRSFSTTLCEAIIDAADLPLVAGKRWNWMDRNDGATPAVVLAAHVGEPNTPMRRIILGLEHASPMRVAHANGDPLDCRRANLIVRNPSEGAASARKHSNYRGEPCTSRFKGVSFEAKRGQWRAMIKKGDRTQYLGRFRDEIAAAEAYDEAARELFGEHARLNFPDGVDAFLANENDTNDGETTAPRVAA